MNSAQPFAVRFLHGNDNLCMLTLHSVPCKGDEVVIGRSIYSVDLVRWDVSAWVVTAHLSFLRSF